MFSATSWASSSGCLISSIEIRTRLPNFFSSSSRNRSTDAPPFPITIPGLAVRMVTVIWAFELRSVSILEMPALRSRLRITRRISRS